jgi:flagellar secretion chaperone FliS
MQLNARIGHAAYQQGMVNSAHPVRIIVLLYEGAIRFVQQAQQSFAHPGLRGHALGRAHRIVSELLAALDHEKGGEIAQNLSRLYDYVLDVLIRANVEGNASGLDSVVQVLRELLEGFRGIERQVIEAGARP